MAHKTHKITYAERFLKNYAKLAEAEKKQLRAKLKLLVENPLHPSLRTKRIQGTEKLFEFSVNMSIRAVGHYGDDGLIIMLDIGQHDVLKAY